MRRSSWLRVQDCPGGADEYEFAGALRGEAVELISCKTVDLEIPSPSEIVIEGVIRPGVRVKDGPYFDYTGKIDVNPRAVSLRSNGVNVSQ